jgi:hypothetical protein
VASFGPPFLIVMTGLSPKSWEKKSALRGRSAEARR